MRLKNDVIYLVNVLYIIPFMQSFELEKYFATQTYTHAYAYAYVYTYKQMTIIHFWTECDTQ